MLKQAHVLRFILDREGDHTGFDWLNEFCECDLGEAEHMTVVFWSHRYKAFVLTTTHMTGSKDYWQAINVALSKFFKANQDIEHHLTISGRGPKEIARYQVWNRQLEEVWEYVSKMLRQWETLSSG